MNDQHLSDEAVAACADGYLTGLARERANRHVAKCAECAAAVRGQREAAWALRAAVAPSLPLNLLDRLRCVPQTTPITPLPTAIGPDGSTMLATSTLPTSWAPMAALVPIAPTVAHGPRHRARPILAGAALVALAGALAAVPATSGSQVQPVAPDRVRQVGTITYDSGVPGPSSVIPLHFSRAIGR